MPDGHVLISCFELIWRLEHVKHILDHFSSRSSNTRGGSMLEAANLRDKCKFKGHGLYFLAHFFRALWEKENFSDCRYRWAPGSQPGCRCQTDVKTWTCSVFSRLIWLLFHHFISWETNVQSVFFFGFSLLRFWGVGSRSRGSTGITVCRFVVFQSERSCTFSTVRCAGWDVC